MKMHFVMKSGAQFTIPMKRFKIITNALSGAPKGVEWESDPDRAVLLDIAVEDIACVWSETEPGDG